MKLALALRSILRSLFNWWLNHRKPARTEYSGVDSDGYYFVEDGPATRRVYVAHPRRLEYYQQGIEARLFGLARQYCIDDLVLQKSDQVVDVGAHSGEFGLWVQQFGSKYLAIEPDPIAFGALAKNLPTANLEPLAVGALAGQASFSIATSTGDSSFEEGSRNLIMVEVETLDEVVGRVFPTGDIALLKIEAEGFEPEVLKGAADTLRRTHLVSVDAGEERLGESTAPDCVNILTGSGFFLRRVFLGRGTFLFSSNLYGGSL